MGLDKSEQIELHGHEGTLYIIPTPIGNLEDITFRAMNLLKKIEHLACEDTRNTKRLLQLLDIDYSNKRFYAYHDHNEAISSDGIIKLLLEGKDIGLVSDAGTPLISDPGYTLIKACGEIGLNVISLPGPSSITAAIAASGLATDRFKFYGFIPQKKGRETFLNNLITIEETAVFFESTHRIVKLLDSLSEKGMKERKICVAKEISKVNERYLRGSVAEISSFFNSEPKLAKGEFVVILEKG